MLCCQHGKLATQIFGLPMQNVAHQNGGFVVEIMAGDQSVVGAKPGCLIKAVPLREATRGAGGPLGGT